MSGDIILSRGIYVTPRIAKILGSLVP